MKTHWLSLLLLALPFVVIAYYWNSLPTEIPMHWNFQGEVDRTSDSPLAIFILPLCNIAVFFILLLIPVLDPKQMTDYFRKTLTIITTVTIGFMSILSILIVLLTVGIIKEMNMGGLFQIILPITFLLMGNYFGKIRPNYFLGIRTPWTLEYEDIWVETHRMAGKLWVGASLVMILLSLLLSSYYANYAFLVYLLIIAFVPIIYSFILYKQRPNEATESR